MPSGDVFGPPDRENNGGVASFQQPASRSHLGNNSYERSEQGALRGNGLLRRYSNLEDKV